MGRLAGAGAAALLALAATAAPLAAGTLPVGDDDVTAAGSHPGQGVVEFGAEMIVADNPSDNDQGAGNDPPDKNGGGKGGGGSPDGSGNGSPGKSGNGNS